MYPAATVDALYATSSIVSPAIAAASNSILLFPTRVLYSSCANFTPSTNTSINSALSNGKNPTLGNIVCPSVAVYLSTTLNVGNAFHWTPSPVDSKYAPTVPVVPPTESAPVNDTSPSTSKLKSGISEFIPTLLVSESAYIKSLLTSRPLVITKFLLMDIFSPEVHYPPNKFFTIYSIREILVLHLHNYLLEELLFQY